MAGAQENARAAKCPFQINKERAPLAQITKRVHALPHQFASGGQPDSSHISAFNARAIHCFAVGS